MAINLKNTTNIKTIIRFYSDNDVTEVVIDGDSEYTELDNDTGNAVLSLIPTGFDQEAE